MSQTDGDGSRSHSKNEAPARQQRAYLQASEEVDFVSRAFDPDVQGLTLLHDDAWRHQRAAGVPQATALALCDAVQLRQELAQRLTGVHVEGLFLIKSSCSTAHAPVCSWTCLSAYACIWKEQSKIFP